MPSPFPGMDPYLEHPYQWQGVHASLIQDVRRQIAPRLPKTYYARTEEDLYIHEPPAEERRKFGRADDAVVLGHGTRARGADKLTVATPAMRMRFVEPLLPQKVRSLEIWTVSGDRIVTVIELISRANKLDGRQKYLEKRETLRAANVSFVQVDLLRAGRNLLPEPAPPHHYSAMVHRAGDETADVWMWTLRDELPVLPVPLAGDDPDVALDLRAALDVTYDANLYGEVIYGDCPDPPLPDADAAWAADLVPRRP